MRVPMARILTWPWLASSVHRCGQYMAVDSIKRALSSALCMAQWQDCKAAGEQSRGWSGGSAEDRGLEDSCVEQLCRQRGPEAETDLLRADSL